MFSISGNDIEDTNDDVYSVGNENDEQSVTNKRKSVIKNVIKLKAYKSFRVLKSL